MYEWRAPSGVRVVSTVPRDETAWIVALYRTMTYYVRRYGLGRSV